MLDGTHYYLYVNECKSCERPLEVEKIGISVYGWAFGLYASPRFQVYDLEAWDELWQRPNCVIKDNLNNIIKPDEMYRIITERIPHYVCKAPSLTTVLHNLHYAFRDNHGLWHLTPHKTVCLYNSKTWDCILDSTHSIRYWQPCN